jgi:hypothetical protein
MQREKIKSILKDYTYTDYLNLFEKYKSFLVKDKVEPSVSFPNSAGEIAVFEFRCNEEVSFNDDVFNNDLLVLVQVVGNDLSISDHFFDVTTDPKSKKPGIAHTCAQIYRGNVGIHRGDPNRPCIRSDFGFGTWILRTDGKGNILDINSSDKFLSAPLHCGINIHNGGERNTSLGCTMTAHDKEYQEIFRPIITHCANKNNIAVSLIDAADLDEIFGDNSAEPETVSSNDTSGDNKQSSDSKDSMNSTDSTDLNAHLAEIIDALNKESEATEPAPPAESVDDSKTEVK